MRTQLEIAGAFVLIALAGGAVYTMMSAQKRQGDTVALVDGPPNPRELNGAQLHAARFAQFSGESRDEAWATDAESQLSLDVADVLDSDAGLSAKSVECRAKMCRLAVSASNYSVALNQYGAFLRKKIPVAVCDGDSAPDSFRSIPDVQLRRLIGMSVNQIFRRREHLRIERPFESCNSPKSGLPA